MDWLNLVSSVASGGVLGLFGTALTGVFGLVEKHQSHKREMAMRKLDAQMVRFEAEAAHKQMALQAESAERVASIEATRAEQQAEHETLQAAYRHDAAIGNAGDSKLGHILEFIRGATRPGLTFLLVLLLGIIFFTSAEDQRQGIIESVTFLASTAVSFWFGSRSLSKLQK